MNPVSGLAVAHVLAAATTNDEDNIKPGLVAFLIVVALGIATWLLLRNMGKQLRRANDHFEAEEARERAAAAAPDALVGRQADAVEDSDASGA